jgi:hypothetical protein
MPDTGHYYYFFPLTPRDGKPELMASIATQYGLRTDASPDAVVRMIAGCADWQAAESLPWMRGKIGYGKLFPLSPDGTPISFDAYIAAIGIWLAVDTNVGDHDRGYLYKSEEMPVPPEWLSLDPRHWPSAPYASKERQYLRGDVAYDLLTLFPSLASHVSGITTRIPFTIHWMDKRGQPFPVDLIVDFGNSRTVALILEDASEAEGHNRQELSQICRPLVFSDELQDAEWGMYRASPQANYVVDSWFILREPEFSAAGFSPPAFCTHDHQVSEQTKGIFRRERTRTLEQTVYRVPNMFTEISPAVIGPGSFKHFSKLRGAAVLCALSSPKRYAWDRNRVGYRGGVFWHMMVREGQEPAPLSGEILAFMPPEPANRFYNGRDEGNPELELMRNSPVRMLHEPLRSAEPDFPKSDGLVWTALSIIEQAERSINCQAIREGGALTRRFLQRIVVTFPSGWTQEEIDAYEQAWVYARNIFYWTRYSESEANKDPRSREPEFSRPAIQMHLDEAVASQLPIVYSEIRHLGNNLGLWFNLFGQTRNGQDTCRVMSIDIGGGTMDTAVVEYHGSGRDSVQLTPNILFTDSSTHAGDKLVKKIIDEVLIPYILKRHPEHDAQAKLAEILTRKKDFADTNRRVSLVKSIFVPIVVRWLTDLSTGQTLNPATNRAWTPRDCNVDIDELTAFNGAVLGGGGAAELLDADDPIEIEYESLQEIVAGWIGKAAEAHARYLAAFQCDLVVVTGKPSEIKMIRAVLAKELPIEPFRIIFANGYYAGDWLPLGGVGRDRNKIQDAKLVTATGAALSQAFDRGLLTSWTVTKIERGEKPLANWWYRLNDKGLTMGEPLLKPGQDENAIEISPNTIVGRVRFPGSEPERVYVFRALSEERYTDLKATLRRISTKDDGKPLLSERLELASVSGSDAEGNALGTSGSVMDFELTLNTLGEKYWLDEPEFDTTPGT